MATVLHQSRRFECSSDGRVNSVTYCGAYEEMTALQAVNAPGVFNADFGTVKSSAVSQYAGPVWQCEIRFDDGLETSAGVRSGAQGPDPAYGKKSATLRGSLLSMPLESHPSYRTNWNHYLASAPGVTASPVWWLTATGVVLTEAQAKQYAWIRSPAEVPNTPAGMWRISIDPTMPGVNGYDLATYSVTESVRCRNSPRAGAEVAGRLNRIGSPSNDFGITGGDWKCDDVSISWTGKYWLATLTWTRSGDASGWNKILYGG